jgi:hypothetical protein
MWNHRIVRKKHKSPHDGSISYTYGIHEAFYDKNHKVTTVTLDPVEPFGENIQELRQSWIMFCEAFGQPILDYDKLPEEGHDKNDPLVKPIDPKKPGKPWTPPWTKSKKAAAKWKKELAEMHKEDEKKRKDGERTHNKSFVGTKTRTELIEKIQQTVIAENLQKTLDNLPKNKKKGK